MTGDPHSTDESTGGSTRAEPSPLDTDEVPVLVTPTPRRASWRRHWAVGTAAVGLAAFEALTGLALFFTYRPLVPTAHFDVVDLVEASPLGTLRDLHVWGAHLLLILAGLHLFRVLVAGAYRPPRRANYHLGVVLGVVVVGLALTGFVLPWDERSRALLALLNLSSAPPDEVLSAAYALHCGLLPVVAAVLVLLHLRRAAHDGRREGPRG